MKRAILALMLLAGAAWAQQNPNEKVQKIITLKYADPLAVQRLLNVFPGLIATPDQRMHVIALSGSQAVVTTAEQAIKQLDAPSEAQKDIDLTVYFIEGTDQTSADLAPIPPDLQSTIATLKQTFPYKAYGTLDVLSLRTSVGAGAATTGRLGEGRTTRFNVGRVDLEPDGTIQLYRVEAELTVPETVGKSITLPGSGIKTDVLDIKPGQKLVIGRTSLEGPGKALFLILIARIAP